MMEVLRKMNEAWPENRRLNIGIGLNSGVMTVGNMGSQGRMNYTLMGDNVNLGARLEGTNKEYSTNIIISEYTYQHLNGQAVARELDNIRVKGEQARAHLRAGRLRRGLDFVIRYLWVGVAFLLSSCGIISIEYLPAPPVPDPTVAQNDFRKLTFTTTPGTYSSNPDFQGYEVYYKLYAPATGPFDNLIADNSQLLSITPTRDYLITLGYQRLATSDQNSGNVPIIATPSNGDAIVLDFTDFFDKMNVSTPPTNHTGSNIAARPTLQAGGSPFFVFRTISVSGVPSYPWFSDLYKP